MITILVFRNVVKNKRDILITKCYSKKSGVALDVTVLNFDNLLR